MSDVNYFEVLLLKDNPASVTDEMVAEAKEKAIDHWGLLARDRPGEEGRRAKEMKRRVEEAYNALIDAEDRKRYIEELERRKQRASVGDLGQVEVRFSLGGKHGNLNFNVVENPVTHPLIVSNMTIRSIQEYVCRAWESPEEIGLPMLDTRSLERWLYYSARETDISNAIRYYQSRYTDTSDEQILFLALDLLQARYPAPIIPRSAPHVLEKIKSMQQPQWWVSPSIANFGLLSKGTNAISLSVKTWKQSAGKLSAKVDNPLIRLSTSQLEKNGTIVVEVNGADVKGGETIEGTLTVTSENFGEQKIPVYGIRMKWMGIKMFNQGMSKEHGTKVANHAKELGDLDYAAQLYREVKNSDEAREAEFKNLNRAYQNHEWLNVIEKARDYQLRYGRHKQISPMLVEALRMIGGTYYQLKQDQPALPYLATLAMESAYLPDGKLPADNWTRTADSQITIDPDRPKHAWVEIAEKLDLRWTHASGTADKSHFAGDRPLDMKGRIPYWRSKVTCKAPLVAYLGIIVARRKDSKGMVGLDIASGNIVWEHKPEKTGGKEYSEPVCGRRTVYFTDPFGMLFALDIETGKERWKTQLQDVRDLQLAYMDDQVVAATGTQVIFVNAVNGAMEASTDKMRGLFAGANPINLIVSDECVLFQKATMFKKTMNFIDTRTGQQLEFQIPHGSTPPVAWAAFEGELYIPYLLKFTGRYPSGVRVNSDGRQETEYTTVKWDELDICVYDGRSINPLGEFRTPIPNKIYYEPTTQWDVKVSIESADIVAMAPVTIDTSGGALTIYDYEPGQPRHFIVAAAFGKDVYYWVRLDTTVEIANHRQFDSKVQSIIFASIQDVVITQSSLSASLLGQTGGDFGYTWKIPKEVGSVVGTPAFYGDVIFVLTQSGEVVAIGK